MQDDSRFLIAFEEPAASSTSNDRSSNCGGVNDGSDSSPEAASIAAGAAYTGSTGANLAAGAAQLTAAPAPTAAAATTTTTAGTVAGAGAAAAGTAALGGPLAYVNFRFELDEGVPIVYCYEVQLEEGAQRKGLGKFMMQLLELMVSGQRAGDWGARCWRYICLAHMTGWVPLRG